MAGTQTLVADGVIEKYDRVFAAGAANRYPSLDLVRLEMWFFKKKPGKLLDYGFGGGANLIHLLECGYEVEGVDASREAVKYVQGRVEAQVPQLKSKVRLQHIPASAVRLDFPDASFDYVVCLSVLSLLGSRDRVERLLAEFRRVLKPGGKIIVDINAPNADFARGMRSVGLDMYVYAKPGGGESLPTYCPPESTFHDVVRSQFAVDEKGYSSHGYCGSEIIEYIACGHRP